MEPRSSHIATGDDDHWQVDEKVSDEQDPNPKHPVSAPGGILPVTNINIARLDIGRCARPRVGKLGRYYIKQISAKLSR